MERDIQYLKGVGPKRARLFRTLGVNTIKDLIFYMPRELETVQDVSAMRNEVEDKAKVSLNGVIVTSPFLRKTRGNLSILSAEVAGNLGRFKLVWFNQPFLKNKIIVGKSISVKGVYNKQYRQITVNEYKFNNALVKNDTKKQTQYFRPIYPVTDGLTQSQIQQCISIAIKKYEHQLVEYLPKEIMEMFNLCEIKKCIISVHNPKSKDEWIEAKKRFIFEEILTFKSALLLGKENISRQSGIKHRLGQSLIDQFSKKLKFKLTEDQQKVITEIIADMTSLKPMNRLLQGDVGSGKTVVAAYSLFLTVCNGYQGAMMVPTEILAEQHYYNLKDFFAFFDINIELLTSSTKGKSESYKRIKNGEVDIIVGTHAILQEKVEFKKLALIVTDEQHRFGVEQRSSLRNKGEHPHVLVMSATPIPRTMSQIIYGDLDISYIKQLPKGRKPIKTYSTTPNNRNRVFDFIKKEISKGQQCYIVCPLVEESDKVSGLAVTQYYDMVKNYFDNVKVGLLHGKMNSRQKEEVMNGFKKGETSILVSTTVIEVGVDVSNANIIVIENSEKFGLSQLHQLRGRVGRGSIQSYCILVCHTNSSTAKQRMKIMTKTVDGFDISEEDLKLRGPGEFFGTRQHGIPEFKHFDMLKHQDYIQPATEAAEVILKNKETESYRLFFDKIKEFAKNYLD
ncbi:ATP-dependent DNA helicase RecG [Proteinivorax tanatarense]|uniref:ATP-dependent DNA helicase RecG n=1 Tax=Proteinivorax tanatarense TaxID=1260629 RepID=A0AAU7VQ27_9FIRM